MNNAWKQTTLGEVAKLTSGGTPSRSNPAFWNGDVPWVTTSKIDFGEILESSEKITREGLSQSSAKLFPSGTLLIALYGQGATRGKVAKLGIEAATNQACAAIIPEDRLDSQFLFYFLVSQYDQLRDLSHGGNQKNLSARLLKNISVPLPPLKEQQKIVVCLACWDRGALVTERLIATKQEQRRGLMQQLLSGKLRFRGFSSPWVEHRLGDLLLEMRRPVEWDDEETYRLVSVRRASQGLFLRGEQQGEKISTKKLHTIHAGDFLISKRQVVHGATGMATPQFEGAKVSDSYTILRARDPEVLDIEFFTWLAKTPAMIRKTFLSSNGVHMEKLFFVVKDYLKHRAYIPSSIAEQRKIIEVFNTADREIELLQQQLATLKEQKKGLMQQLLTGKVRVKPIEATE